MKSVLCTAALSAIGAAQDLATFESFVEVHARTYQQGSAEFEQRKSLYQQRLEDAQVQNSSPEKTWTAGVNKLWDWTEAELQTLRGWDGSMMPEGSGHSIKKHSTFLQQADDLPKEKMWNTLDTFAYVKNQGDCGSCWAIASSTVLEAHNEIYNGNHRIFSTQQIVECTPNPRHCGGDGGCKGATAELAMDWVLKNGVADASQIPYTAQDGTCTRGSATADMKAALMDISAPAVGGGGAAIGMTGWSTLPKNEYEPLARALAESGPVAVSVAADTWFSYESGIFNGCGKDAVIDHAVTAIGYGEEDGKKYWAIQNSWGKDWGEEGIIRLERHDKGDYCGMNNDPQKGVACQGETAPVPVCGMCGVLFDSVVPHFKGSALATK
jgi:cathepsin L